MKSTGGWNSAHWLLSLPTGRNRTVSGKEGLFLREGRVGTPSTRLCLQVSQQISIGELKIEKGMNNSIGGEI